MEIKERIKESKEWDDEVIEAFDIIKENGPRSLLKGLQEWNLDNGLILFRDKIYIPKDNQLRREVVQSCHNPIAMGHPGQYKTLEIVQRNFWWPGMSNFVKNYVEGCAICQESKNITHPMRMPLQPTELPNRPFQFITMDFITDLPESEGYNAILVVVDQFTKTIIIEPCNKTIDADITVELLIKRVFCKFGIPEKIILDRGPQFASKVMKTILKNMGI
jgi:hypothetical protein